LSGCATEEQWDAGDSFEDILDCLRKKSARELMDIQGTLANDGNMFLGPTIDEADGVLPEDVPTLLRKRRPYPQLIGTTSREFRVSKAIIDKEGKINQPLLSATCVLLARNRGFKHPVAIGRACAEEYSKRRKHIKTGYYLYRLRLRVRIPNSDYLKNVSASDIADLSDDIGIYLPTYNSLPT
jgi:hypothetical protein